MKRRKNRIQDFVPEWSLTVDADDITERPETFTLRADGEECAALARRFGVLGVEDVSADMTACRDRSEHVVHIEGTVRALLLQTCILTLEPVSTCVEEHFEAWYADPGKAVSFVRARAERLRRKGEPDLAVLDEEEDPEPIVDGTIDLGELATQYLALAVPLYPRSSSASERSSSDDNAPVEASPSILPESPVPEDSALRKSPFSALKTWKAERDDSGRQD